jgi:Skp family chaperone for outer membrane proteins|tara:strand:+ start:15070 stop:16314 length:1245 start_codon:yes stop_codon:yes gene_type:complete
MNLLTFKILKLTTFKKASILFLLCLMGTSIYAQKRSVRIGYIDTEYILENVTEYSNANAQLDSKIQQWKGEIEKRLTELEDQKKQLNNERILLTNELISEREEDLQIIENEIIDYQQKRFGPNGDLMIQKQQLIQPIQDQIFAAVQEIAASKKYDFIFDKSADVVMLYSADRYDISEQVLRTINRSSKRTQVDSRKERKEAEEEETIVEVDDTKDDRQRLLDERKAEREALLEEKRQKKLDAREARRKEVQAKKQKALDKRAESKSGKTSTSTEPAKEVKVDTEKSLTTESTEKVDPREARKKELAAKKQKALEKRTETKAAKISTIESAEKVDPREARKKELAAKKQKALEKRANAKTEKTTPKTTAAKASEVLNDREARKKALQEKKKQALAERKARLEAQKKKRDSIRNNK